MVVFSARKALRLGLSSLCPSFDEQRLRLLPMELQRLRLFGICHSEENFRRGLAKSDIVEKDFFSKHIFQTVNMFVFPL